MYSECAQGRGWVALIDGGVASGKTDLVNSFTQHAVESGATLLRAAGSYAERTIELGVVGQLFHNAAVPAELTEDVARLIDTGAPVPERSEARVMHAVCRALLELAADRPLVIAVDDIQFADSLSLQTLLYLQRRIGSARVLLILNQCVGPDPVSSGLRADLLRQPRCRRFRLRPLSREGVALLLADRLCPDVAEALTSPVHVLSGGNPLLVAALVEDYLRAEQEGPANPVVGEAFRQAVLACLHRGDPALPRAARALAVAGELATAGLLARMLDLRPSSAQAWLDVLHEAGLADAGRFRHPAVRAQVIADCPDPELIALHGRLARLLHEDGAAAAEIAPQLVAAGGLDDRWAGPVLAAAAEHALATDDVDRAVEYLGLARNTSTDGPERAALAAELVRAHWRANPSAALRYLNPLREALDDGHLADRDTLLLTTALAWHGRLEEAAEVLGRLGDPERQADRDIAREHHLTREWLRCWQPQLWSNDGERSVTGLSAVLAGRPAADAVDRAERVLQSCRLGDTALVAVHSALHALLHAGSLDRATRWCDQLLEQAEARRFTTWVAVLADVRSAISLRRGDLPAAERHAQSAMAALPATGWGVAIGSPLAHLVLATTLMGKLDQAAEHLRQVVPQGMSHSQFWLQYLQARGTYYLAADRPHAALADFHAAGELATRWGVDFPATVPWRLDAARVHVHTGRKDLARDLVSEQLARPGADEARIRGRCLRVLASTSEPKQRQAMLHEAMDLLQDSGDRYELAHTYADLSQAAQALGRFNRARMMGRHAMRLAKDCHAEPLRRALMLTCDPPKAGDPGEADGVAALSDAERRVVTLAARGHTNREIGRKLYITVSTVEQHLTRAYRKLKISSRTDLLPSHPLDMEAYA